MSPIHQSKMGCRKLRVIGSGSYSTVFLASIGSGFSGSPVVAVKSSELQESYSLEVEGQFLKELKGCEFVIQGFGDDISVENGKEIYNLLLEYAPGGTLENVIQRQAGYIVGFEVSHYAYQLLKGLLEIHNRGIVHCDMKPANVLVFPCECGCRSYNLKIADFGLAKLAGRYIIGQSSVGSLVYMSPESLVCGMHEPPKDIWAVGCMVMEMFTGRPIWESICDEDELKWHIAYKEPEIPDGISLNAKDFLKKCFERDPKSRPGAESLLAHPFVATEFNLFEQLSAKVKNPFGGWSSHKDLFSD